MKKYENKKLFTTNIRYLSKSHPQFLTIFDSVNLTTNLVIDDHGEYDIDVGAGQLLYGNNSKGAAEINLINKKISIFFIFNPNSYNVYNK